MKIVAHTSRGIFESIDEPIPTLDRAAVKAHFEKRVASLSSVTMNTKDGFIVLPGEIVGRSVFTVENFNTPEATE
jgi:hypothetical protein